MSTFSNKGQRMPNIFERARAYEDGNEGYVQQQKPKTNIVINTNRLWYGEDSTVSAFLATAYDEQGNTIDSMRGQAVLFLVILLNLTRKKAIMSLTITKRKKNSLGFLTTTDKMELE